MFKQFFCHFVLLFCAQNILPCVICLHFSTLGYLAAVPFMFFYESSDFLILLFPLGIFSLGSVSLLNFIESRVHGLYFTVLPHSFHESKEHCYFIVWGTYPLYILNQVFFTAFNQMEGELASNCILNKHITPSKSLLDNLFCIFFLPNICADGKITIISNPELWLNLLAALKKPCLHDLPYLVLLWHHCCAFPSLSLSIC